MIIRRVIDVNAPLTEEQKAELEYLRNMSDDEIICDEDCPELTDEELAQFKRVNPRPKKSVG